MTYNKGQLGYQPPFVRSLSQQLRTAESVKPVTVAPASLD